MSQGDSSEQRDVDVRESTDEPGTHSGTAGPVAAGGLPNVSEKLAAAELERDQLRDRLMVAWSEDEYFKERERLVVEVVGLREQLEAARETNKRLNRRVQLAEAACADNVEQCKRSEVSFGRMLANWGYVKCAADLGVAVGRLEKAQAALREIAAEKDREPVPGWWKCIYEQAVEALSEENST